MGTFPGHQGKNRQDRDIGGNCLHCLCEVAGPLFNTSMILQGLDSRDSLKVMGAGGRSKHTDAKSKMKVKVEILNSFFVIVHKIC